MATQYPNGPRLVGHSRREPRGDWKGWNFSKNTDRVRWHKGGWGNFHPAFPGPCFFQHGKMKGEWGLWALHRVNFAGGKHLSRPALPPTGLGHLLKAMAGAVTDKLGCEKPLRKKATFDETTIPRQRDGCGAKESTPGRAFPPPPQTNWGPAHGGGLAGVDRDIHSGTNSKVPQRPRGQRRFQSRFLLNPPSTTGGLFGNPQQPGLVGNSRVLRSDSPAGVAPKGKKPQIPSYPWARGRTCSPTRLEGGAMDDVPPREKKKTKTD